jgi:hypothetical protein
MSALLRFYVTTALFSSNMILMIWSQVYERTASIAVADVLLFASRN